MIIVTKNKRFAVYLLVHNIGAWVTSDGKKATVHIKGNKLYKGE